MWASGELISMATAFNKFIEIPSISELVLDWKPLIISTISPGLVLENSRRGVFLAWMKLSGTTVVLLISSATCLPAFTKNLLNSFVIISGSFTVFPEIDNLLILHGDGSDPTASLIKSQVFFGFFLAFWKFTSK